MEATDKQRQANGSKTHIRPARQVNQREVRPYNQFYIWQGILF